MCLVLSDLNPEPKDISNNYKFYKRNRSVITGKQDNKFPQNMVEGCGRTNPFNVGVDPDQGLDPGIFYTLSLTW